MSGADRRVTAARRGSNRAVTRLPLPLKRERLQRAIAELPSDERLMLALSLLEGLSPAETAELTGRTSRSVAAACDRMLTALRRALHDRAPGERVAPGSAETPGLRRAV
ncbi:MAG TPA: sigma factor-like helix-turn-helix DNA-binding protein [Candidatus Sulfotelmatobacter sp.]|nr:sigma factor-like helix-turn-helix DNA-binding protein [Candidatus Sulfotelmatobacter sp.]